MITAALLLALALPVATPAASGELEQIQARARELEERLREIESRQSQASQRKALLEQQLALASVRVQEAEAEQRRSEGQEREAEVTAAATQRELDTVVGQLRVQLGTLAVLGRPGMAPLLLQALGSGNELPRRITLTLAIVNEQERRRVAAADAMERRAAAVAALSRAREASRVGLAETQRRRALLVETRGRVAAELRTLEVERRSGALALAGVREEEERLERLWGLVAQQSRDEFDDVRLVRGALPWPVANGKVVQGFGGIRDPRYGTMTVSNGLDLAAPSGSPVRAVAAGRVVYAQFMKGYGNVVIVHHGREVYSLYGRLASSFRASGERVGIGDSVGQTGPSVGTEANLYIEMRVGQKPQDPLAWLKPTGR